MYTIVWRTRRNAGTMQFKNRMMALRMIYSFGPQTMAMLAVEGGIAMQGRHALERMRPISKLKH